MRVLLLVNSTASSVTPRKRASIRKILSSAHDVEVAETSRRGHATLLARAAADDDFGAGRVDTGFIERGIDALVPTTEPSAAIQTAAALALIAAPSGYAWTDLMGFRANAPAQRRIAVSIAGSIYLADAAPNAQGCVASVGGRDILFLDGEAWPIGPGRVDAIGGGGASDGAILSPMPGKVIAVDVEEGQAVTRGQKLLTLEAMKMEHGMVAPFDGVVRTLSVKAGDQVGEGALLARIEARAD